MIVYSKKIVQFVHEIKSLVKTILSQEMGLKVSGTRFFDQNLRASYPIKVVIYNDKAPLGYFDPSFYELGFHERLMTVSRGDLISLIRHELAHYMVFIKHGAFVQSHGPEFREFCEQMGWGEEVYKATFCIETSPEEPQESSVLRKVKKLMALASSSNAHEAEVAMIKSQQLLLKHNLESTFFTDEDGEKVVLQRLLKSKRASGKMRSIARILETFFVSVVYHKAVGAVYLEILGTPINVEIAEYVASFLDGELERLWAQVQRSCQLKGLIAKNSFFLGLAKGYCDKIQALKQEHTSDLTHALMILEKQLEDAKRMAYSRLSTTKSRGNYCEESSALGELMGRALSINPAINRSSNRSETTQLLACL